MIRDAIVFRCEHRKVREKCVDLTDELKGEKAVEIVRNHETNLRNLGNWPAAQAQPSIHWIKESSAFKQKQDFKKKPPTEKSANSRERETNLKNPTNKFGRCGFDKRSVWQWNSSWNITRRWIIMLNSKTRNWEGLGPRRNWRWCVSVCLPDWIKLCCRGWTILWSGWAGTRFQLDSGAKANVMSLRTYSNLQRNHLPVLKKTHCTYWFPFPSTSWNLVKK